jgi:hypothetical protein
MSLPKIFFPNLGSNLISYIISLSLEKLDSIKFCFVVLVLWYCFVRLMIVSQNVDLSYCFLMIRFGLFYCFPSLFPFLFPLTIFFCIFGLQSYHRSNVTYASLRDSGGLWCQFDPCYFWLTKCLSDFFKVKEKLFSLLTSGEITCSLTNFIQYF